MIARKAVGVPPALFQGTNRVLRPKDITDVYAHPRGELARLTHTGAVRRLATGYYALAPQHRLGDPRWRPGLHAAALGVAQADYGAEAVALMGGSAARYHGAIPREMASAVVAIPKQRPPLRLEGGEVVFVCRNIARLDVERVSTELGTGWVTTVEQTMLDLADRPTLGGLTEQTTVEAIQALAIRADRELLIRLVHAQHKPAALHRIHELAGW